MFRYVKRPLLVISLLLIGAILLFYEPVRSTDFSSFEKGEEILLTGRVISKQRKPNSYEILLDNIQLLEAPKKLPGKVLVIMEEQPEIKCGYQVLIKGSNQPIEKARNPGQFDEWDYYSRKRIYGIVFSKESFLVSRKRSFFFLYQEFLLSIREKMVNLYETLLPAEDSGILCAMLFGEKALLDKERKREYRENGIAHLLAVSGLHVSLLCTGFISVLKRLKIPNFFRIGITLFFLYSYVALTGFSISTCRAALLALLSLLALPLSRTYDMLSALSFSCIVLLLNQPDNLFDPGFQLSFGAVAGIGILFPIFLSACKNKKNPILSGLLVSFSVTCFTLPIQLWHFYEFSISGIFLNLLVVPLLSFVLLGGVAGGVIGLIWQTGGKFFLGSVHFILKFYQLLCQLGEKLPYHKLTLGRPTLFAIFLYLSLLFVVSFFLFSHKKKYFFLLFFLSIFFFVPNKKGMRITFLDVGQGDGAVIEIGNTVYLIDGGSSSEKEVGEYSILPFLKYRGISSIQGIFISHADFDHISGILWLIESGEVQIKQLFLPEAYLWRKELQGDNFNKLIKAAKKKEISILYLKNGDQIKGKNFTISCLAPYQKEIYSSENALSMVLEISYQNSCFLFLGDLEEEGETLLIDKEEKLDYDIIKVAHHGSKNSLQEESLKKMSFQAAIISCGRKNRYGHPHEELLERLYDKSCQIYQTPFHGAIQAWTDGEQIKISTYKKEEEKQWQK